MALFDILKSRKREEQKPERLPRGAFSPKANQPLAEKQPEKAAKKRKEVKIEDKQEEKSEAEKPSFAKVLQGKFPLAAKILMKPHVTEQSAILAEKRIYIFKVASDANKPLIEKAIKELYGFEPVKVRLINAPAKTRRVRGKIGRKPGFKKAFVFLKEGDKIEFI
jgi:large subunit ribosomal protein L23